VSSTTPLSSATFGPRFTSHVPSSSCRTRQRPPRPLELCRRLKTLLCRSVFSAPPPPAIFSENPAAPHFPAQPSLLPHGVPAERATPRPPVKPHRRASGHHVVTALSAHAQYGSTGTQCRWTRPTVSGLRLKCRPSTVRRFFDFQFLFNISKIHINFKNV
jgi:hypothetical protein